MAKRWFRVLDNDELPEGRVTQVTCEHRTLCLTHFEGQYGALDNKCPHQGGPLGEGAIENGWLRCPWHGWDYHPITGKSPGEFAEEDEGLETFEIEKRDDGVYVALPDEAAHVRTVSDVMVETMVNWGVKHVWGMVGHSNLGLADAYRRQVEAGNLSYYGIRHEGAASFACSAYGKLTGRPAVCLAIAGPGATNLLTGLWDANVDRSPVLATPGQVDTQVLGPGAFQEIDLSAAFGKVSQFEQVVLSTSKHAELVNLALKSAVLNRGVSTLIFPDEVQTIEQPEGQPGTPTGRVTPQTITPPAESLEAAVELLRSAKRPVIVLGHGARFNMAEVIELAEAHHIPIITTFKGKGLIADSHPLAGGVLGRSGTPIASWFMNESDLMLVFGASFSNHTGIYPSKPIIQVDFDAMQLGRVHAVTVPVWGEIGITAHLLIEALAEGDSAITDQREELAERWRNWRAEKASRVGDDHGKGISAAALFESMTRLVPKDAIIPVDVGNNTYSFGRYFECEAQAVLMSGYLGSIGFALPAAMGAWAATQEEGTPWHRRKVVSVSGDGGLGQYLAELTTLVKYRMNITHVVMNNRELGKISKEQRSGNFDVWQTSLVNPGFAEFAENCGALGIRVESRDDLDAALERAIDHDGPSLVEVITDAELL